MKSPLMKMIKMGMMGGGAAPAIPWYLAGGVDAADCIAVYQPVGAASYAASKVNIVNPGTYDLTEGNGAVPWAANTGWNAVAAQVKYFDTGIQGSASLSAVAIFLEHVNGGILGSIDSGVFNGFALYPGAVGGMQFNQGGIKQSTNPIIRSGTLGLSGTTGYVNGAPDTLNIPAGTYPAETITLLGIRAQGLGVLLNSSAKLLTAAFYSRALTDAEQLAIHVAGSAFRLLVFGDSIAAGVGASDAAHQWANIVAAAQNAAIINKGDSGSVLQNTVQNTVATIGAAADGNGRDTFAARVNAYYPGKVLILYGLNDLRLNDAAYTADHFETDLGEVVDGIIANGTTAQNIVIGSPSYMNDYAAGAPYNGGSTLKHVAYVAKCAAVAAAKGTKYIDVYQWMIDNGGDALVYADGIHPNDAGHAAIAAAFLSVL